MSKILVLGINGMAGHIIFNDFLRTPGFEVYGVARNVQSKSNVFSFDITDLFKLKTIIDDYNFEHVVNCIGILNKSAEDNPAQAIWYNSYFPHYLEEITKGTTTKIIHISTDCVFSGKRGAYTELDFKDGIGYYAQSKALGELNNFKDITLRTSIIGPELKSSGIGLFHWFMSQRHDSKIEGYAKAYWSGITTIELSNVIKEIITQKITGLITVAPTQKIDKYSLLMIFNKIFRNGELTIDKSNHYQVDKSLASLRSDFNYQIPSYETMIMAMKEWISDFDILYPNYK